MKTTTQPLKTIMLLLIPFFLWQCGGGDDEDMVDTANLAPEAFIVTAQAADVGLGITLTWTEAIDPEGEAVVYDVFVGENAIVQNLNSVTYQFNETRYNQTISGFVEAKDTAGKTRKVAFSVNTSNLVAIPDPNFEQALIDLGHDSGTPNGNVAYNNVSNIIELNVRNKSISNLTGIEAFLALERFGCSENNLTSLDVSQNTALTLLWCNENQLTNLDVSKNTALTELQCLDNQLTSLDVSQNTALTRLICSENQLTSLDVSQNTALTGLWCYDNQLTNLNLSQNALLENLECDNNQINSLDLSQNTVLRNLFCHNNELTSLNIANGNNVNFIWVALGNNHDLSCVQIDSGFTPPQSGNATWSYDAGVTFSEMCN